MRDRRGYARRLGGDCHARPGSSVAPRNPHYWR